MKNFLLIMLTCLTVQVQAQQGASSYPVLLIPRTDEPGALLKYKLTAEERRLFKEIDSETAKLPPDADLSAYHAIAIRIGKRFGLGSRESVAFFTRTTFSQFEPETSH